VGVLAGGLVAAAIARPAAFSGAGAEAGGLMAQAGLLAALMAGALLVALVSAFATAARRVQELEP
jgi:hypothetical protein